jgi:hypothetical protein
MRSRFEESEQLLEFVERWDAGAAMLVSSPLSWIVSSPIGSGSTSNDSP